MIYSTRTGTLSRGQGSIGTLGHARHYDERYSNRTQDATGAIESFKTGTSLRALLP